LRNVSAVQPILAATEPMTVHYEVWLLRQIESHAYRAVPNLGREPVPRRYRRPGQTYNRFAKFTIFLGESSVFL
jgi:hypothetical protein